jgi:beta-1,4-mannosyl-glycoprotein beta-1,4-N-acetylglucosaminyltransferase
MIYDTFIFNKDFLTLEIRFHELYDTVDKFVLVEADTTFQGNSKPFHYEENKERFAQFSDKIIHHKMTLTGWDAWSREKEQRNGIGYGLSDAQPDDIILVSDCDEIPRASAVATLAPQRITALKMNEYYYSLNMKTDYYGLSRACYFRDWQGAESIRRWWTRDMPMVENAGWHFSYLFDPEGISEKIKSFAHMELNTPDYTDVERIKARIANGSDLYDRKSPVRQEIDSSYPQYVLDNLDKFKEFIK